MKLRNYSFLAVLTLVAGLMLLQPVAAFAKVGAGQTAPNISFKSGGKSVPLATFHGQKVMLWLFSTWCPSCSAGLAALAQKQAVLKENGVRVVVLENYQNGGYAAGPSMTQLVSQRAGAVKDTRNWTIGTATQQMASVYNPKNYPDIYYLIGTDGKITAIGSAPSASMKKILSFAQK